MSQDVNMATSLKTTLNIFNTVKHNSHNTKHPRLFDTSANWLTMFISSLFMPNARTKQARMLGGQGTSMCRHLAKSTEITIYDKNLTPFRTKVCVIFFSKANTIVVRDWSSRRESWPPCSPELETHLQFDLQDHVGVHMTLSYFTLKKRSRMIYPHYSNLAQGFHIFWMCFWSTHTCNNQIELMLWQPHSKNLCHSLPFLEMLGWSHPKLCIILLSYNGWHLEICSKKWTTSMNLQYYNEQILNDLAMELSHHFWTTQLQSKIPISWQHIFVTA